MSKHTPGPWETNGRIVRTSRGVIAVCPLPQEHGVFECSDNPCLIAAAPTMLAELKADTDFLQRLLQDSGKQQWRDAIQHRIDSNKLIIAKAEGAQ